MSEKFCNKCHEVFPLTNFYKKKSGHLGVTSYCKTCFKESQKNRYKRDMVKPQPKKPQCYQDYLIQAGYAK